MANLEENTSLIVALSEIEKKVVQAEIDRDNLKTNLSNKGVDVSGTDKMQGLVEKINNIKLLPRWLKSDSWINTLKPMTIPRSSSVACSLNNKIHVIGGIEYNTNTMGKHECLNVYSDVWETKSPLPLQDTLTGCHVIKDKIYVLVERGEMFCYDLSTDTWTTKNGKSRYSCASCEVDGKIYLIGGNNGTSYYEYKDIACYDSNTDTWTTKKAQLPYRALRGKASSWGEFIYINPESNITFCYDISLDSISQKAMMPGENRGVNFSYQIRDKIYVLKGINDGNSILMCYDPFTDTWTTKRTPPNNISEMGSCIAENNIFGFGGKYRNLNSGYGTTDQVYVYVV